MVIVFHGIIAAVFLVLFALAGIVIVLFGLPGTFVILFGAALYDLISWSMAISWQTLLILLVLAGLGELFDVVVGGIAARRFGSSNIGTVGAIVGAIIGGIVGVPVFVVGSLLGMFLGAFVGAFAVELLHYRSFGKAFKAGIGAFAGKVLSIFVKLELAVIMLAIIMAGLLF
ncbi:DUF456 domain-containing protein [Candidatus Woesearchaeota archaeon]|nr:DUF456 domain-containing protein [Candidatus Woesearchaeota archaeon]